MTQIIRGLATAWSNLLRRPTSDIQKLEALLERSLPEIGIGREKVTTSRENVHLFGEVIEDYNPIHRILEEAQEKGLPDTPLMGVYTAAYAEQFAQRLVDTINEIDDQKLGTRIRGLDISFTGFAYPNQGILWQLSPEDKPYLISEDGLKLKLQGLVKDTEVARVGINIGRDLFPSGKANQEPALSRDYNFDNKKIRRFYRCLDAEENGAPNLLPALYAPSTLLFLLREKTREMEGINKSMDIEYVNNPIIGLPVTTDLMHMNRPPRQLKDEKTGKTAYLYPKLNIVSRQGQTEIARTSITCLSEHYLDIVKKAA